MAWNHAIGYPQGKCTERPFLKTSAKMVEDFTCTSIPITVLMFTVKDSNSFQSSKGDHICSLLALVWDESRKYQVMGPSLMVWCPFAPWLKQPKAQSGYQRLPWLVESLQAQHHRPIVSYKVNRQSEPAYCWFGNVLLGDYRSNRTFFLCNAVTKFLDH